MEEEIKKKKQQRKKRDQWIVIGIYLLLGLIVGFVGGMVLDHVIPEGQVPSYIKIGSLTFVLLGFYLSLTGHIFIHETGHMIFGLLSGYQFVSIRFFNLMFVKQDGKMKIKKMSLSGTGGQCLMLPPATDGSSPTKLYHLGGCIFNFIFSILSFCFAGFFTKYLIIWSCFLIFGICGIGTAMINFIPFRSMGNDGYNAFTLSKRKDARIAVEKTLLANKWMSDNIRVKDMPNEWFIMDKKAEQIFYNVLEQSDKEEKSNKEEKIQGLQELLSDNLVVSHVLMKMNYFMDRHEFKKAEKVGRILLENAELIDLHELSIKADLLYIEVIGERRKEVVNAILDEKVKKKMKLLDSLPAIYRVWYAFYSLYEPEQKKAKKAKEQFEKLAIHYPYLGDIISERELIEIVDTMLSSLF